MKKNYSKYTFDISNCDIYCDISNCPFFEIRKVIIIRVFTIDVKVLKYYKKNRINLRTHFKLSLILT